VRIGGAVDAPEFDPATATEYEILARAKRMQGRTLGELADSRWSAGVSSKHNKGGAGTIVERYFGISQNSEQAPDFRAAGIELKVCPLVMDGTVAKRVKERTSVTMIDYVSLDRETWETASVRPKIRRILFVFYAWLPDVPLGEMRVKAVRLWSPSEGLGPVLERDWRVVWQKNRAGKAHELSEGDGLVMGAVTKGATGGTRPQPYSDIPAKSRAWSLKPKLTWSIYSESVVPGREAELVEALRGRFEVDPVDELLARVEALVGRTLEKVALERRIVPGRGKSRAADVLRLAIGLRQKRMPSELEALGLTVKTVPMGPDAEPYEAMSFPAFDPRELVGEDWEDSDLLASISNMLVVPFFRGTRKEELLHQRVCRPFRWAPDREQLAGIRAEWERARDLILAGRVWSVPTESNTRFIHIRPKARNSHDRIEAPGGIRIVKQCFWLNREFVRELVLAHHTDWRGF
jgi:DNA mismatch repair protein MutH